MAILVKDQIKLLKNEVRLLKLKNASLHETCNKLTVVVNQLTTVFGFVSLPGTEKVGATKNIIDRIKVLEAHFSNTASEN